MSAPSRPENDDQSFGQYLRQIRLEKNIGLTEVSRQTRLRVEILRQIEAEALEKLPAEVFVKGFIRAYARAIGADEEEALRRYQPASPAPVEIVNRSKPALQLTAVKWGLAGLLLAVVVVALFWGLTRDQDPPLPPATPPQSAAVESDADQGQTTGEGAATADVATGTAGNDLSATTKALSGGGQSNRAQKYHLKIGATEATWLKVIVDDEKAAEYTLNPGDRLDLEARMRINLLIGNAAGVRLTLNGKAHPVQGKSGPVVNVVIP